MPSFTTKFNVADKVYVPILANASLVPLIITEVYFVDSQILYAAYKELDPDKFVIRNIEEDTIMSFSDAKAALLTYLNDQITRVTTLIAS